MPEPEAASSRARWLVFGAVAAVFLPALFNGFVNWDDGGYLVENQAFRGFGSESLRWMLTNRLMGVYQPLAWLSYALDYALWGMAPAGFHLTNLLLHAATAAAFCAVAELLFERAGLERRRTLPAAIVAALLFGLHPLRVESVAWASERRDVLCGLFYALAVLAYLRGRTGWSLAAAAAALLSKGMAITIPAALLVLDTYPLRRPLSRRLVLEKWPYAFLAAVATAIGMWAQVQAGNGMEWRNYGAAIRLAQASYGLAFYLWKTALPLGLSPLYIHGSFEPLSAGYLLPAAALAALGWLCARERRRRPWLAAGAAFYALTLLPVLGLVPYGPQLVADRYSYISCLPLALLAGARLSRAPRWAPALLCAGLAALTVRQIGFWRDSETLWRRAVAVGERNHAAYSSLALVLDRQGRGAEAIPLFERSLAIMPMALTHNNLGAALAASGRLPEALAHFEAARRLEPGNPAAEANSARARRLLQAGSGAKKAASSSSERSSLQRGSASRKAAP